MASIVFTNAAMPSLASRGISLLHVGWHIWPE